MAREVPESHPLLRLFRGLAESTFLDRLGIGDPNLVGYVSSLLARFMATGGIWDIRDDEGRSLLDVTAMIVAAESTGDPALRRACHQHVGDFTLFWTGVYPEALAKLQRVSSADHLIDFRQQGKRSYRLASETQPDDQASLLRRLSDQFELCAFGLSCVRKEWEQLAAQTRAGHFPPRLVP